MNHRSPLRVVLVGDGDQAERWTSALRDVATVHPYTDHLAEAFDALVLAPGAGDPFSHAKAALLANVPVLYAAPFRLSPWQSGYLNEVSVRQSCLLRFIEPFQYRPGFAFLHRLLRGREPFWRPLYVRTLCLAPLGGPARLDDLATEELALCEALLGAQPEFVSAAAGRGNEGGEVCAAFLILHYHDGPTVQCTVSLAEATTAHQVVAATADRTAIIDDLAESASVRIVGGDDQASLPQHGVPSPSCQVGDEGMTASAVADVVTEEAKRFLRDVAAGDLRGANGGRWSRAAGLWWAARQSMGDSSSVATVASPTFDFGQTEPPPLRVIQGGGSADRTAARRPSLTVVAR